MSLVSIVALWRELSLLLLETIDAVLDFLSLFLTSSRLILHYTITHVTARLAAQRDTFTLRVATVLSTVTREALSRRRLIDSAILGAIRSLVGCHSRRTAVELVLEILLFVLDIDDGGITSKSIVLIELSFTGVTFSAERHVHVCTSNHAGNLFAGSSERETSILLAELADR